MNHMELRLSVPTEQECVREVLRIVEQKVGARFDLQARHVVSDAFARTSQCRTADETVELLYHVPGFRQFALRLMWLLRLMRMQGTTPADVVMENEIERLVLCLVPLIQDAAGNNSIRAAGIETLLADINYTVEK